VAAGRRIVVIGGGAAGLAAAARLCRRADVVLLEARDRLGGRVDTRADPRLGIAVERGAELVHGRPTLTLALARRAGVRVLAIPDRHAVRTGGRLADGARPLERAEALLRVGTRDDVPFAAVLRAARRRGRPALELALAAAFVRGFYLADPRTASSGALARFTRALDTIDGGAIHRVEGGYARVLEPLRRDLEHGGAELRLSTRVEEVRWRRGRVEVLARGPAGGRLSPLRADAAIVTVPVSLLRAGGLRFRPALPEKRRAAEALGMGPIVKVLLRFRRAPWTDAGRRALSFLHVPGAPVPVFWTLAPLRAPVLVGWAGGPDAAPLAGCPAEEVVRAALTSAARGLGRPAPALEEALDGAEVIDWTRDPLAGGGYAVFPVGSAGAAEALARPVERTLFFAGEATDPGLVGTVEGALRSGERAARELLAARGDR
jgi:monoamine oxidase